MASVILTVLICASRAEAEILQFDLIGKAGSGLTIGNEHPTVPASGGSGGEAGSGITFDTVTLQLAVNIAWGSANGFTNLTGNATAGHIHNPTPSAAPASFSEATAPLINFHTLPVGWNNSASSGGFTGTFNFNATQAQQLLEGRFYINIHTAANGPGEIRGTMVVVPEPATTALVLLGLTGFAAIRIRVRKV